MTEPGYTTVQTQALQENAERLGIVWKKRPATIVSPLSDDPTGVTAIMDGDTVAINVYSLIGVPAVGSRVMCDIVPPSGIYVTGYIGPTPGSIIGGKHFTTGGTYASGVGAVETLVSSFDITINEPVNRLMILEVTYKVQVSNSGSTMLLRIRRDGLLGNAIREDVRTVASNGFGYQFGMRQALKSLGSTQTYVLTAQIIGGGGTCDVLVSPTQPNFFLAYDEGNYSKVTVV